MGFNGLVKSSDNDDVEVIIVTERAIGGMPRSIKNHP